MAITEKNVKIIGRISIIYVCIFLCFPVHAFSESSSSSNYESLIRVVGEANEPCKEIKEFANREQSKAIEPLIKLLKSHKEMKVQKCIAETLAMIDIDRSVNILINSLNDSDLLAASRSAFALGVIKDKRATDYLLTALFESHIPCPAAQALGMIKDPSTFEPLIKAVQHEKSSIRGCAIRALALYGDPCVCEMLSDVFMTDNDRGVQFMARMAREEIKCPRSDKQSAKYSIDDKYCISCQRLIDIATPLLGNTTGLKEWQTREWQKSPEWQNAASEILPKFDKSVSQGADGVKDFQTILAICSLVTEWGENVVAYRLAPESQTMPQKMIKSSKLSAVKDKMEKLYHLCPNLKFPDYDKLAY